MRYLDLAAVISDTVEMEIYCRSSNTGAWIQIGDCYTYDELPPELENAQVAGIEPVNGTLIEVMLDITVDPEDYLYQSDDE